MTTVPVGGLVRSQLTHAHTHTQLLSTKEPCFYAQRTVYTLGRPAPPPAHSTDTSVTAGAHFALVGQTPGVLHAGRPKEVRCQRAFLDVSHTPLLSPRPRKTLTSLTTTSAEGLAARQTRSYGNTLITATGRKVHISRPAPSKESTGLAGVSITYTPSRVAPPTRKAGPID